MCIALAAGCSGQQAPTVSSNDGTKSPTPVAGIADDLQPFYMQQLHWRGCGDSFQCSTLTVPMDYANPATQSLHLALIRLPAKDQKHRLGSLVINPGGPGASGVDFTRAAKQVISDAVRKRFDIVGFDPRGVGRSDPVHCLSDTETDAVLRRRPDADDAGPDRAVHPARQGSGRQVRDPGRRASCRSSARGTPRTTWTSCGRRWATRSCPISASPTAPSSG